MVSLKDLHRYTVEMTYIYSLLIAAIRGVAIERTEVAVTPSPWCLRGHKAPLLHEKTRTSIIHKCHMVAYYCPLGSKSDRILDPELSFCFIEYPIFSILKADSLKLETCLPEIISDLYSFDSIHSFSLR